MGGLGDLGDFWDLLQFLTVAWDYFVWGAYEQVGFWQ